MPPMMINITAIMPATAITPLIMLTMTLGNSSVVPALEQPDAARMDSSILSLSQILSAAKTGIAVRLVSPINARVVMLSILASFFMISPL